MDGLTNGGGAQHHFIQPEPALSLSKNSAPNTPCPWSLIGTSALANVV
jgi:hypothetical protein